MSTKTYTLKNGKTKLTLTHTEVCNIVRAKLKSGLSISETWEAMAGLVPYRTVSAVQAHVTRRALAF